MLQLADYACRHVANLRPMVAMWALSQHNDVMGHTCMPCHLASGTNSVLPWATCPLGLGSVHNGRGCAELLHGPLAGPGDLSNPTHAHIGRPDGLDQFTTSG